jgi:hypothetical protein
VRDSRMDWNRIVADRLGEREIAAWQAELT